MTDSADPGSATGFQWDDGNAGKNFTTHDVTDSEAEQVFFNHPKVLRKDSEHSKGEDRYYLLGVTDLGRALFVSFTMRGSLIRIISARDMTRKELRAYGAN
jgi:uncharacterized protein